MPFLIDGHNLIPHIPGLRLSSPDDEEQLILQLQDFCQRSGKQAEVYFDNAPAGGARKQSYGRVKAIFVRAGRTADAAIHARLKGLGGEGKNWSVVSSDREVQVSARRVGARILSAAEFEEMLTGPGADAEDDPVQDRPLSAAEVDEWLALFGPNEKAEE